MRRCLSLRSQVAIHRFNRLISLRQIPFTIAICVRCGLPLHWYGRLLTDSHSGSPHIDPGNMHVQIFTTGGTIDKVYFDAKSTYEVGDPQIATILAEVNGGADFTIETLFRKDSLDLTDDDRQVIHDRVAACSSAHILITHGTDTMVATATKLATIPGKTIVLVGSLSPARFKGSDAEFNIGFAFAAVQLLEPGSYVAMNGQVFRHDRVRKNPEENRFEVLETP